LSESAQEEAAAVLTEARIRILNISRAEAEAVRPVGDI
jgi:hypothetical protein